MPGGGTPQAPTISLARGPNRPDIITSYGTTFFDPNSNRITLLGGQPISAGTMFPLNAAAPTHFAGGRGSRKIEIFHPSSTNPLGGTVTTDANFLGDPVQAVRTYH